MAIQIRADATTVTPTMTDSDVLDFCKKGILILPGIVDDRTNRWVYEYLDREGTKPNDLVADPRFAEEVLLHPKVAGVARSLLGANFQLPDWMANHRLLGPRPAGRWHIDAGSDFSRRCDLLQIFYIPQDVTVPMGPTLFLPGSHLAPITREELDHFGGIAGQISIAGSAGSVIVTDYDIWHRQSEKVDPATRNLLKWECWRTVPPTRDWVVDPDFDFHRQDYSYTNEYFQGPTRKWQSVQRTAELFYWLCGKADEFRVVGGSGWPYTSSDPRRPQSMH